MKTYYYVYRQGYGAPTRKHDTLESAHTESLRLASQHPGAVFEILQCVGITQTVTAKSFWADGVTPPTTDKSVIPVAPPIYDKDEALIRALRTTTEF